MAHVFLKLDILKEFCEDAFREFGFSEEDAATITDVLLLSDKYGIESHGMQRLVRYHKGIRDGVIKVDAKPEIVFETPVSAVVEGHDGMGQLIGVYSMKHAIEKARQSGVGIVTARNSNHYGIAGYYAQMASEEGLLGMSFTNSEAIMVPTFSKRAMLGSNPIAIAMPADPYPFFFDASTTVVTRGKLEMYKKAEEPLHDGWALDENGNPCNDAERVLQNISGKKGGGIMPLGRNTQDSGSHKGYGYGMICEIFTSILSMGLTSNHTHMDGKGGTCHGFIAIDPAIFGNPEEIRAHLSLFLQELRDSPKAEGQERVYTHGEKEVFAIHRVKKEGVPVDEKTLIEMMRLASDLGIDFSRFFGDIRTDDGHYASLY